MLHFNGETYPDSRFNYTLYDSMVVEINSPLTIEEYIEKMRKGEEPEGDIKIVNQARKTHIEFDKKDLLMLLYSYMGICPKFVGMEEYDDKTIGELQILSNQVLWYTREKYTSSLQMTEGDIRAFFMMNKYSREMLKESGFNEVSQVYIMKALNMVNELYKIRPEYSAELNTYLHSLYNTLLRFETDVVGEFIGIYYKAPFLCDYLIEIPRNLQDDLAKALNYLNNNELVRDELNTWVMEEISPEQIDVVIKLINKAIFDNSIYTRGYHNKLLYLDNEELDSEMNIFIAPELQNILQEETSTPYTRWYCPELNIEGTLAEPNMKKIEKFINAINSKIDELVNNQDDGKGLCQKVTIDDIDPRLLKKLEAQDGEGYKDYDIEENLEKAIKQLLVKSKLLKMMGFYDKLSIIEEDGIKYSTQYGDIYKCENSLKHRIERNYQTTNESAQYTIYAYDTNRRTTYYYTTPDVAKNMGLMLLQELKAKALDGEILNYIKNIEIYKDGILYGTKKSEEILSRKILQHIPIVAIEESYTNLREGFKERFGRTPRIMSQIATAVKRHYEGREQEFIDNFNYKNISKIIGQKTSSIIRLSDVFNWSETPKGLQEMLSCYTTPTNVEAIAKNKDLIIEAYKNVKEREVIALLGFIDRVDVGKMVNINEKIQEMYKESNNARKNELKEEIEESIKRLIVESKQEIGKLDAMKAEKTYDYKVINNSSKLLGDNICVMTGPYRAYFLNSMDYEHFSVGYDTSCCQHIGGAAEECVVAASSSPHCGTLVIKTHEGVTKAQAFVWEALDKNGDKVLVLDNMEFANDKEVKDYLEILYAFCKESPYQTIHMGLGFNEEMSDIGKPLSEDEIVCRPIIPFMDSTFNYSDYGTGIYLKQDGEVTFNPKTTYYTQEFDTPSIIETNSHGINISNDSNILIAQHYDVYYDNCAKTTQVINKDGEIVQPKQYPLYPFESTHINPENHIMKWENIEPTDIAITITKNREDIIIIKPIALDGQMIPQLNEKQMETIMQQVENLRDDYPNMHIVISPASTEQLIAIKSTQELNLICNNYYLYETLEGNTLYGKVLVDLPKFNDEDSRDYDYEDWEDEWDEGEDLNEETHEDDMLDAVL